MRITRVVLCSLIFTMLFSNPLESQEQRPSVPDVPRQSMGQSFLAGIITAINIPLRGILCVADAGMGVVVMGASAGRGYAQAAEIMEAGCSGPWMIDARTIELGRMQRSYGYSEGFLDRRNR